MSFESPPGATPLNADSLKGLIPNITLQSELDEFEARNIAKAIVWARSSRKLKADLLSASGISLLHKKMFNETWDWAGKFRATGTNIGVSPDMIQNQLGVLFGDVKYWIENRTFPIDEIAARFHHKLVWIHPFTNGNGRCTRLVADLLLQYHGVSPFSWGGGNLGRLDDSRSIYLSALKTADRIDDYRPLIEFARS